MSDHVLVSIWIALMSALDALALYEMMTAGHRGAAVTCAAISIAAFAAIGRRLAKELS